MPVIQHLIADQFGSHVGKYSGRLKVTKKGETLVQAPLLHLESVMITNRGVSVSAEAIRACTERGIPIHFLSGKGVPYAALYSAGLMGTVMTRRAQLMAYHDERAVCLAVAFATGKIENQANLLKYVAKYRKEKEPETFQALRLLVDEVREHLGELDGYLRRYTCTSQILRCLGHAAELVEKVKDWQQAADIYQLMLSQRVYNLNSPRQYA